MGDEDYRCPTCGFYRDTPNHELGCEEGRGEREERKEALERVVEQHGTIPLEQHRRAIMNAMQLDMLRRSEEERVELKQRLRKAEEELEELRGSERDQAEKHRYSDERYDKAAAELARLRAEHRVLQEQTGAALVRAHVARGDRELDAAKLAEYAAKQAEQIDVLRKAILDHLDAYGYDGREGLADALVAIEDSRREGE